MFFTPSKTNSSNVNPTSSLLDNNNNTTQTFGSTPLSSNNINANNNKDNNDNNNTNVNFTSGYNRFNNDSKNTLNIDNFYGPISTFSNFPNTNGLTTSDSLASSLSNTNEHLKVTGLGTTDPLNLSVQYIDHLYRRDENTPILDDRSYYNNGVKYNFTKVVGGLGAFTPFERQKIINIPEELLQEASNASIKSNIGIFPEIDRCWITIDNKLVFWNINDPFDFKSIEDIKHTILNVALVKPKPNTFVDDIQQLLLISTPFDIYILAVSYNRNLNELNIFNTGMNVSINGLGSVDIVGHESSGRIFFISTSSGLNVWELQYTGSDDWFNSKCNKVCLTQSVWTSLLPSNVMSLIPGGNMIQSLFEENSQETLIQITIDQSRGIIYTLSSKSVIRAYLIVNKGLEGPSTIEPSYISRIMGTTMARGAAILGKKYLRISKIIPISLNENNNIFYVAVTIGGVRLYFNGSVTRSNIEAIRLESIKFPPSSVTPDILQHELQQQKLEQQKRNIPFYSSLSLSESVMLKTQKKSAVLLETTRASTIISPGIFFSTVTKSHQSKPSSIQLASTADNVDNTLNNKEGLKHQQSHTSPSPEIFEHRLFVSVPDYGILKHHGEYVENATFLETTSVVRAIVPLTSTFHATNKPSGYANEFATQYTTENLHVAVLTNSTIEIYKYRTPDEVFETLIDNPLPFALNYGLSEACSSALFVTCKFNKPDLIRSGALTFLTLGIPGVIDIKPRYDRYATSAMSTLLGKSSFATTTSSFASTQNKDMLLYGGKANFNLDDVILSPRFYGIALLITRLLREIWEKSIFTVADRVKTDIAHTILKSAFHSKENNIITGISVSRSDIEYYLSSIIILTEFFEKYGDSLTRISTPLMTDNSNTNKAEEVSNQAENIAINALIRLTSSIKEALSFLNVLYEESEIDGFDQQYLAFKNIFGFLKSDVQNTLSKLKFKDLFAPNDITKFSVREILLSIINRNISRGASIEYTATTLQERCGSFCSTNDILSFRALEHLRKAKEIGTRDFDALSHHLDSAMKLFEVIADDLSINKLKEAVNIMLELNYYPKTIEFLLSISGVVDKGNLAYQYVSNGSLPNDERKKFYDKRVIIYDLVFETLIKVDNLAASSNQLNKNPSLVSVDINSIKDESYMIALSFDDELFHYHMYDWLVSENNEEKLLALDTKYILPYLNEKAKDSLKISTLLWIYHSRKHQFYKAAEILYALAISDFEIKLHERIEFLARANGFCNSDCPPSEKQDMVRLSGIIKELFDVTSVQDDTLVLVLTDTRIDEDTKKDLVKQLDGNILSVSDLFNDYAVPLGYHEVALNIFKISDFRDQEEIMAKWEELFESLKREVKFDGKMEDSINFINLLSNVVIKVGRKIHISEFAFPVSELFPRICDLFDQNLPKEHIKAGSIISIFISSQVSYNKLYYILKDLIETRNSANELFKQEMVYLIKEWYQHDRKLRDSVSSDAITNLTEYSIENDPIERYYRKISSK